MTQVVKVPGEEDALPLAGFLEVVAIIPGRKAELSGRKDPIALFTYEGY
jgi:hypothetical protein